MNAAVIIAAVPSQLLFCGFISVWIATLDVRPLYNFLVTAPGTTNARLLWNDMPSQGG
ncbi:MAG: hypothetical protein ACLQU3_25720 [Limisphaerales bacterium]